MNLSTLEQTDIAQNLMNWNGLGDHFLHTKIMNHTRISLVHATCENSHNKFYRRIT